MKSKNDFTVRACACLCYQRSNPIDGEETPTTAAEQVIGRRRTFPAARADLWIVNGNLSNGRKL